MRGKSIGDYIFRSYNHILLLDLNKEIIPKSLYIQCLRSLLNLSIIFDYYRMTHLVTKTVR